MFEDLNLIEVVATILGGALVAFKPAQMLYRKVGAIAAKAESVMDELKDVLVAVAVATEDGRLTADEIRTIVKESKDVFESIKNAIDSKG